MSTPTFHYEQRRLENDVVALEIFEPGQHAARLVELIDAHPEVFTYLTFPVIESLEQFLREVYEPLAASPADCIFAIVDKTAPAAAADDGGASRFAGVVTLADTSKANASAEIGIIVFPAFQRSHVASNAIGLALQWLLDPPSLQGLGLRRVLWQTHVDNAASRQLALRMGFELEGIARWQRVFPLSRPCQGPGALPVAELEARNGTTGELPGRHTAVLSLVWDEWDAKRPGVLAKMARRA